MLHGLRLGAKEVKCSPRCGQLEALRTDALNTRLFAPAGRGNNLVCQTDRSWDEPHLAVLTGWLSTVVERILEFESVNPGNTDE